MSDAEAACVQMENEELRMGQTILAAEVQSLRRDLGALAARSQVRSDSWGSLLARVHEAIDLAVQPDYATTCARDEACQQIAPVFMWCL